MNPRRISFAKEYGKALSVSLKSEMVLSLALFLRHEIWSWRRRPEASNYIKKKEILFKDPVEDIWGFRMDYENFKENYKPSVGIKLIAGNVEEVDSKITIPHYLAMFI